MFRVWYLIILYKLPHIGLHSKYTLQNVHMIGVSNVQARLFLSRYRHDCAESNVKLYSFTCQECVHCDNHDNTLYGVSLHCNNVCTAWRVCTLWYTLDSVCVHSDIHPIAYTLYHVCTRGCMYTFGTLHGVRTIWYMPWCMCTLWYAHHGVCIDLLSVQSKVCVYILIYTLYITCVYTMICTAWRVYTLCTLYDICTP